jgi:hypothetical protein
MCYFIDIAGLTARETTIGVPILATDYANLGIYALPMPNTISAYAAADALTYFKAAA